MILEDIKGLGTNTIKTLKENGIDSVQKLADIELEKLMDIKGIGKSSAKKFQQNAKDLLEEQKEEKEEKGEELAEEVEIDEEERKLIEEEKKKLEEKKKRLKGKSVEEGDFILVKITGRTRKGQVFRVSSEEDAKKAGIYDEEKAQQGHYSPEFVIVGEEGFVNEGLTETIKEMTYFEKKSVRIPPAKAFGKRDPKKLERMGIGKYRRANDGKAPEIGQEFVKKTQQGAQRGRVRQIAQGKVLIDYNHPLAGQPVDYNLEIVDKIEEFEEKIKYFIMNKNIPEQAVDGFEIDYDKEDKSLTLEIPRMLLFQNLTYVKFGIAMDLQKHMSDKIGDVRFVEVYEKPPEQPQTQQAVMDKVKQFEAEEEDQEEGAGTKEGKENENEESGE
ncbi:MAG: helix-hairpin-helix domain-containing protein [Promethearchaeia archaeon]